MLEKIWDYCHVPAKKVEKCEGSKFRINYMHVWRIKGLVLVNWWKKNKELQHLRASLISACAFFTTLGFFMISFMAHYMNSSTCKEHILEANFDVEFSMGHLKVPSSWSLTSISTRSSSIVSLFPISLCSLLILSKIWFIWASTFSTLAFIPITPWRNSSEGYKSSIDYIEASCQEWSFLGQWYHCILVFALIAWCCSTCYLLTLVRKKTSSVNSIDRPADSPTNSMSFEASSWRMAEKNWTFLGP